MHIYHIQGACGFQKTTLFHANPLSHQGNPNAFILFSQHVMLSKKQGILQSLWFGWSILGMAIQWHLFSLPILLSTSLSSSPLLASLLSSFTSGSVCVTIQKHSSCQSVG